MVFDALVVISGIISLCIGLRLMNVIYDFQRTKFTQGSTGLREMMMVEGIIPYH